jgi:hypothetical protein
MANPLSIIRRNLVQMYVEEFLRFDHRCPLPWSGEVIEVEDKALKEASTT